MLLSVQYHSGTAQDKKNQAEYWTHFKKPQILVTIKH